MYDQIKICSVLESTFEAGSGSDMTPGSGENLWDDSLFKPVYQELMNRSVWGNSSDIYGNDTEYFEPTTVLPESE